MRAKAKLLAVIVVGGLVFGASVVRADPSGGNGGGPFKPCATCKTVTPPPPPPPVKP
jgi:hypothetical protein